MTRTVRDAALMLQVMAGPDERDLSSLPVDATEYLLACEKAVRGLRVAWSVDLGYAPVDPEVRRAITIEVNVQLDVDRVHPARADQPKEV